MSMIECDRCGFEATLESRGDGSHVFVGTALYAFENLLVCPKCYVRLQEQAEIRAIAKQRYGPNRESAMLR